MKTAVSAPQWNPYQTFVWTNAQLAAWYDRYGTFCPYNGELWKPKIKNLGAGRKEIKFVLLIPE